MKDLSTDHQEPAIAIFVTASSEEEAARLGKILVEAHAAACATIVPRVRSIYRWEGKVADEGEALLIVKSRKSGFAEILALIKGNHSYSVPEVIALPVTDAAPDYLQWLNNVTK
jgi:periplasmic divalent cation tolerance protein